MPTERLRGRRLELRAYAGTNPATGKPEYLYESVPADLGVRELNRVKRDLDARANELSEARRARRKDPTVAPEPKPKTARIVAEAIETWWRRHGSKLDTARKIRSAIDSVILPEFGDLPLALVAGTAPDEDEDRLPDVVYLSERWAEVAERRGLEPSTVHKYHGILGGALRRAGHPIPDPGLPPMGERASTTPLPEEMAAFLPHLGTPRVIEAYTVTRKVRNSDKTVSYQVPLRTEEPTATDLMARAFALLVASGPRPVAAAAIARSQLDQKTGRLSLDGRGVVIDSGPDGREVWVLRGGTTAKRRLVNLGLDGATLEALKQWLKYQDEMSLTFGHRLGPRALIFSLAPDASEPISPKVLSKAFDRAVDRARETGVSLPEGFRLYDMRHFGITSLLRAGVPVAAVAKRFGTSPRMIHARYEHAIPEDDDRMVATLGTLFPMPGVERQSN